MPVEQKQERVVASSIPRDEFYNRIKDSKRSYFMNLADDNRNKLHPTQAHELVVTHPELKEKYKEYRNSPFNLAQDIDRKPELKEEVYNTHYNQLYDKYQGNLHNVAHAWKNGQRRTDKALESGENLKDNPTVKQFFKNGY